MKLKIKNPKFIRNIIIGLIALLIVAFIINIAPGYKRNKYTNVINVVIGSENVTENLKKPIYKDEEGAIYISKEDIKELLDEHLFYDEENKMIITTSEVCTAGMKVGEKTINVNGSNVETLYKILEHDNTIYIPIEEMEIVYNIDVKYKANSNTLIIDKLNEGMVKAELDEDTVAKYKPRRLSKTVTELKEGEVVSAFYTTSKGWRLIRTENGEVGYIKANTLTNEYILRQDMKNMRNTQLIAENTSDNSIIEVDGEKIVIRDLFKVTLEGVLIKNTDIQSNNKIWANLELNNVSLNKFEDRALIIKNVISLVMKNKIDGINVIVEKDNNNIERFVIEIAPRLREIGIKTNVILSEECDENIYKNVVDYIIKK